MVNGKSNKTFRKSAVILILFLCSLPSISIAAGLQWMTPQRTYALIKEGSGLWLVDIRNEAAFTETHIEGAVNIPATLLPTKQLPKGKIIVLADDSLGLRKGREAAEVLIKNGHEKVYLLEGGMLAWQVDRYPLAGKAGQQSFRSVMPEDIAWAQENRIPLRIFDLRDKGEQDKGPVLQSQSVNGASLAERLEKVKEMMANEEKKGLAARLDKSATTILIMPAATEPRIQLERSFRGISGDIRYLEGGYAAWAARPDKTLNTVGTCPTCPGGVSGGKK
jgi:rhodanese-related sulfurtransferase